MAARARFVALGGRERGCRVQLLVKLTFSPRLRGARSYDGAYLADGGIDVIVVMWASGHDGAAPLDVA